MLTLRICASAIQCPTHMHGTVVRGTSLDSCSCVCIAHGLVHITVEELTPRQTSSHSGNSFHAIPLQKKSHGCTGDTSIGRFVTWPRGVTVSTLDSDSSDRGSNPREAFQACMQTCWDSSHPVRGCVLESGLKNCLIGQVGAGASMRVSLRKGQ